MAAANEHEKGKPEAATSIIRIGGKDINGNFKIVRGLMQIKGIGYTMARALALEYGRGQGVSEETRFKDLSDPQIAQLETLIKEPQNIKAIPRFLLNRRKDSETGSDMHLIGTDLAVKNRQDVEAMVRIQTWRGHRHQYGQKVRGQRTRSTGRTGATVGVMKKTVQAAAQEAKKASEEKK